MANEPKKVRQRRSMLQIPGVQTILSSLLCIVLGLLVGFVVLLLIDHGVSEKTGNLNAIDAILVIIKNFWKYGSSTAQMKYLGNTLVKTAPLLMCGLSVLFAYKVGLFNIGAAGQYVVGAGAALYCALAWNMPWYVCLLAAALAGALLACISGALKAFCNVNEVISGIMLNWIALYITNMLLTNVKEATSPYTYQLKAEGRFQEIQKTIKALKKEHELNIPKDLAYVEGKLFEDYIHDMKLTQQFAMLNRKAMVDVIMTGMGFTAVETFTTIHNYIDTDAMILRKGSVSAKAGEKLLIPINMRDGSLICIGKGNEEWNCSAPHGAGRLMSRRAALNTLSMETFRSEMEGIYTTCVVPDTLDESPMAYKSMDEIIAQIGPTADIVERIRPVYNFKASD